jgi:hypothetical protein
MCARCSGRSGGRARRVWQLVASLIAAVVLWAELRRHRVRREPVPAHRPGHGGPSNARSYQGSIHAGGAPLRSRTR